MESLGLQAFEATQRLKKLLNYQTTIDAFVARLFQKTKDHEYFKGANKQPPANEDDPQVVQNFSISYQNFRLKVVPFLAHPTGGTQEVPGAWFIFETKDCVELAALRILGSQRFGLRNYELQDATEKDAMVTYGVEELIQGLLIGLGKIIPTETF